MIKKEVLKFTLQSGITVRVSTRGISQTTLVQVQNTNISISEFNNGYSVNLLYNVPKGSSKLNISEVVVEIEEIDIKKIAANKVSGHLGQGNSMMCSTCNGIDYCVNNGCVDVGCGWLCH